MRTVSLTPWARAALPDWQVAEAVARLDRVDAKAGIGGKTAQGPWSMSVWSGAFRGEFNRGYRTAADALAAAIAYAEGWELEDRAMRELAEDGAGTFEVGVDAS